MRDAETTRPERCRLGDASVEPEARSDRTATCYGRRRRKYSSGPSQNTSLVPESEFGGGPSDAEATLPQEIPYPLRYRRIVPYPGVPAAGVRVNQEFCNALRVT